ALLELRHAIPAQRRDEVAHEGVRRQVHDPGVRLALEYLVADGAREVRLAEADAAVDEERVVVLSGLGGDGPARGVRELGRRTHDEAREGVLRVEARGHRRRATRSAAAPDALQQPRLPPPAAGRV